MQLGIVKKVGEVPVIGVLVPGQHESDTAARHVTEAGVEAHEVAPADEIDASRV